MIRTGLHKLSSMIPAICMLILVPAYGSGYRALVRKDTALLIPEGGRAGEVIIEISVPPPSFRAVRAGETEFQSISMNGYGKLSVPGQPALPVKGILIAVPEGAMVDVDVIETGAQRIDILTVLPAPRRVRSPGSDPGGSAELEYIPDPAVYSRDAFFPQRLAEVSGYGSLRGINVACIRIFPVRYNPARGVLEIPSVVRIRVGCAGGEIQVKEPDRFPPETGRDPFERIFRDMIVNYHPELPRNAGEPLGTAPTGGPQIGPAGEAWKVSVDRDGIYVIGHDDLVASGIDPGGIDPRTLKIYSGEAEIPVEVHGEDDGVFDGEDCVEFFGCGGKGPYSRYNVYRMTWGGEEGLRTSVYFSGPGDSLDVPSWFFETVRFENEKLYYPTVFEGEGKDHWFWSELVGPSLNEYTLYTPGVFLSNSDMRITVNFRGKTDVPHLAKIILNRRVVMECDWISMLEYEESGYISQRYLHRGNNNLQIDMPGTAMDQVFFNWIELEFRRAYTAEQGCLRFSGSLDSSAQYEISGFTSSDIGLFRITNPGFVDRLDEYVVEGEGGVYTVVFEDKLKRQEYFAVERSKRLSPASIVRDNPSDLRSAYNRADYIIITHGDFADRLEPLIQLRRNGGLRIKTVRIEDIYDEFNCGNEDPGAVRDFLSYAYHNWYEPPPSYVLLVGDASLDYRGNITGGNRNFVPTHLFVSQTEYFETSSDNWFVCVAGNDMFPEMLIGRLPGQTQADIDAQVSKIVQYENDFAAHEWRGRFVLVADDPDQAGDFPAICDNFASVYIEPLGYEAEKIYVEECYPACKNDIIDAIDRGCAVCAYVGHGSIDRWTREQVFMSPDVALLGNTDRYPVVLTYNCLNGYFHDVDDDYCIAEEFVRASQRGAVACWSPSGLEYSDCSEVLGGLLFEALLADADFIVGSAVARARIDFLSILPDKWDQSESFILFGDPALEAALPSRPDLLPGKIIFDPLVAAPGQPDTVSVSVYNAGRDGAEPGAGLRFTCGHPDSASSMLIGEVVLGGLAAGSSCEASVVWLEVPLQEGEYTIYAEVDPEGEVTESCEWNNIFFDTLMVRPEGSFGDSIPPSIEVFVDGQELGTEFIDGGFTTDSPWFSAVISDTGTGVNYHSVEVMLGAEVLTDIQVGYEHNCDSLTTLYFETGKLDDGDYTLRIWFGDCASPPNHGSVAVRFTVESGMKFKNVKVYPNPTAEGATISYFLSRPSSEVTLHIYSIAGRLVRTIRDNPGEMNLNACLWDGLDDKGGRAANGVYFFRMTSSAGGAADSAEGKIVLLR